MFNGHPSALRILFFTEMWERFSYYGMRALLVLYMTQVLHWPMAHAAIVYGWYTGLIYLTPIIGGLVADRVLGTQRAIMGGAALMAAGHFALALPGVAAFYGGLLLLVLGCGLFKPCVSVLVGTLYAPGDPRRDAGFSLFYMGINLGAFLAPLVCGTLGQVWGFHWGFASAGIGMLASWAVFAWGWHGAPVHPSAPVAVGVARTTRRGAISLLRRIFVLGTLALLGNVLFWAAFEQAGSSIEIFVDRYVDMHFASDPSKNLSSLVQAINPLFIISLAPVFAALWQWLANRDAEPLAPAKFVVGLALCAASFSWLSVLGARADAGGRVSIAALSVATLLSTCGELCISPVGLSLVSKLAPPRFVSAAMGLWLASIALANLGSGTFASRFDDMSHAAFFGQIALGCGIAALLLLLLLPWLNRAMQPTDLT